VEPAPWLAKLLLVRPARVLANLERVRAAGVLDEVPNAWQLSLAVLRMWHRLIYRPETVGTSGGRVRPTWRARLLHPRALRLPFLLGEGAVVPLDFTGLASDPERLVTHLLGAHHDRHQFVFDLEILAAYRALPVVHRAVAAVVDGTDPRASWLRDLTVFEGYHEHLLAAVEHALAHGPALAADEAADPDLSFSACMRWCARQPPTPAATFAAWRAGRFRLDGPVPARPDVVSTASVPALVERDRATVTARDLAGATRAELDALARRGQPLHAADVAGWRYHGVSLGLPAWIVRLTWLKFGKEFHRDPDGTLRGWNVRMIQDGLDRPWQPRERDGRAITFGHFAVVEHDDRLLLDYGRGGNRRLDPIGALRDPIVALDGGRLLLGWSYLEVTGARVPTPSYFVLERGPRVEQVVTPPRASGGPWSPATRSGTVSRAARPRPA
jgi:hypothetical protein